MVEPYVGMSFGHYKTCSKSLTNKYGKTTKSSNGTSNTYYTDKKGRTVATSKVSTSQEIHGDAGGCWIAASWATFNISSNGLIWSGMSETNNSTVPDDCAFTRIIGSKTYAEDLNGNGVVDEGEIFSFADNKKYNKTVVDVYNKEHRGCSGLRGIQMSYKPTSQLDCIY